MSMSSLKIRGGEVFLVALPIRRPHHWVGHTARIGEGYVVLRLALENGIIGWGEAQVIGTWGGDHASLRASPGRSVWAREIFMIRILNGMFGAAGFLIGVLPTAAFAQLEETADQRFFCGESSLISSLFAAL
jgi:L-alanine-DL-glutamate epimerase-like enolase superfamily enzyme